MRRPAAIAALDGLSLAVLSAEAGRPGQAEAALAKARQAAAEAFAPDSLAAQAYRVLLGEVSYDMSAVTT